MRKSATPDKLKEAGSWPAPVAVYPDWCELVERIRSGDPQGIAEFYHLFSKPIRSYLARRLGAQEAEDGVQDTLLSVVEAIRKGDLREPQALASYVRATAEDRVSAVRQRPAPCGLEDARRIADSSSDPEAAALVHQRTVLIQHVLKLLPKRDQEVLHRFYLRVQRPDEICSELGLTETQFRLLKSRAKARFHTLGRKIVVRQEPHSRRQVGGAGNVAASISRILPVVAHAVAVFGDEHKASHWLATPLPLLANRPPSQVLQSKSGLETVEQLLTRIEHNIPS